MNLLSHDNQLSEYFVVFKADRRTADKEIVLGGAALKEKCAIRVGCMSPGERDDSQQ